MLKPADGAEGVKNAVLTAVKDAGPNACPPMVVGVGIGGTFEKCAILAKKALTRPVNERSSVPYVREMEEELLQKSMPWGSARAVSGEVLPRLQSISTPILRILPVCRWQSIYAVM